MTCCTVQTSCQKLCQAVISVRLSNLTVFYVLLLWDGQLSNQLERHQSTDYTFMYIPITTLLCARLVRLKLKQTYSLAPFHRLLNKNLTYQSYN